MDYEHDVFISYKRERHWTPWVRKFGSYLTSYLQQELGFTPRIFIDERIETGADWVDELGHNLASSKVIVPLFSKDYFGSEWCIHELDLMMERTGGHPSQPNNFRLIVPAIVHDGDAIPAEVQRMQAKDLKVGRVIGLCEGTLRFQEYSTALNAFAPDVGSAISAAPAFDRLWIDHHKKRFNAVYAADRKGFKIEPTHFKVVRPGTPAAPPRPSPRPTAP